MPSATYILRNNGSVSYRGWELYADRHDGRWMYYAKRKDNRDLDIGLCQSVTQVRRFIDEQINNRLEAD